MAENERTDAAQEAEERRMDEAEFKQSEPEQKDLKGLEDGLKKVKVSDDIVKKAF